MWLHWHTSPLIYWQRGAHAETPQTHTHARTGEDHTCLTQRCEDRRIHKHIQCNNGKENIGSDDVCWNVFDLRGSESNSPFETDTMLTPTQPHMLEPSSSPPPRQLTRSNWGRQGPSVVVKREGSFFRAALETKLLPETSSSSLEPAWTLAHAVD